mgnify:CR=1 FL=1
MKYHGVEQTPLDIEVRRLMLQAADEGLDSLTIDDLTLLADVTQSLLQDAMLSEQV